MSSFLFLACIVASASAAEDCECASDAAVETPARNQGGNLAVVFLSVVQVLCTYYIMHRINTRGWEPLWVLGIEVLNYFLAYVRDGAESWVFNGTAVPWLRFASWLVTCPVLLMYLVAMTTCAGRAPAVRLVPLLIANQCMILSGITAIGLTGMGKWLVYMFALANGSIVFTFSLICLISIRQAASDMHGRSARLVATVMAAAFILGWGLFPLAYTTGSHGTGVISKNTEAWLFIVGDLLSKNLFCGLSVYLKGRYLSTNFATPPGDTPKLHSNESVPAGVRRNRRPSLSGEDLVTAAINGTPPSSFIHLPIKPIIVNGTPPQSFTTPPRTRSASAASVSQLILADASPMSTPEKLRQLPPSGSNPQAVLDAKSSATLGSETTLRVDARTESSAGLGLGGGEGGLETEAVLQRAEAALDALVMLLTTAGSTVYPAGRLQKAGGLGIALARLAQIPAVGAPPHSSLTVGFTGRASPVGAACSFSQVNQTKGTAQPNTTICPAFPRGSPPAIRPGSTAVRSVPAASRSAEPAATVSVEAVSVEPVSDQVDLVIA